jgi:hypothetical protein
MLGLGHVAGLVPFQVRASRIGPWRSWGIDGDQRWQVRQRGEAEHAEELRGGDQWHWDTTPDPAAILGHQSPGQQGVNDAVTLDSAYLWNAMTRDVSVFSISDLLTCAAESRSGIAVRIEPIVWMLARALASDWPNVCPAELCPQAGQKNAERRTYNREPAAACLARDAQRHEA